MLQMKRRSHNSVLEEVELGATMSICMAGAANFAAILSRRSLHHIAICLQARRLSMQRLAGKDRTCACSLALSMSGSGLRVRKLFEGSTCW
eukprot:6471392-Amphidinium_carterae.3